MLLTMFRPVLALAHCNVADIADTVSTESLVKPRSLFPHLHWPGTGRPTVPKNVDGTLKAKVAIALFFLLFGALKNPIRLHVVAIVGVAMSFKVGAFFCFNVADKAVTCWTMFLVILASLGPSRVEFGRVKELKWVNRTGMSGVCHLHARTDPDN